MRTLTLLQARRLALAAQGFAQPRPTGRIDVRHFRRVLDRLNLLQLDSVNVAVRAHYMPMFSRLGPYDRSALDAWINGPETFEYWGHEASVLPIGDLPLVRHRMGGRPEGRVAALLTEHPEYFEAVFTEVAEHGPLTVSDLSDPGTRTGPWWGHGRGKVALDGLYTSGRLTVRGRTPNFVSIYDLPERFFPPAVLAREESKEDAQREMLLRGARALGVGTVADLADYYRISGPEARPRLAQLVADGRLESVAVEGWRQPAYLYPGSRLPRRIRGRALLSPFDSLIWARERVERLFGFRYRIEIYVPRPQRRFGYYVYPFLLDEELTGRVDLKADRKAGVLRVLGSFLEEGQDPDRVAPELAGELRLMAGWLGLGEIHVSNRGNLSATLRRAM